MPSKTAICNMALSMLGVGKQITALDTDRSSEGNNFRLFYDTVRDQVLSDFPWPFATRRVSLGLVEENPNDEWGYSYRYPSDCLRILRISSGTRTDSRQSRISYEIGGDDTFTLLYCDLDEATIKYISRIDDTARYPAPFVLALAAKLALHSASIVTGGDPFKLSNTLDQFYLAQVRAAAKNVGNEEQPDEEVFSEFTRARE